MNQSTWCQMGIHIFKGASFLFILIGLCGCRPGNCDNGPSTFREIKRVVGKGIKDDCKIYKKSLISLPGAVNRAMMPKLSMMQAGRQLRIERRFDISAEAVPAKSFFLSLTQDTPYNVMVHPNVEGTISLNLKGVTIPDVLETVKSVYGYDFKQTNRTIEILPAAIQTRAFKINYLDLDRMGSSEIRVTAGGLHSSGAAGGSSGTSSSSSSGSSGGGAADQQVVNSKIDTTSNADLWKQLKETVEIIVGIAGADPKQTSGRKVAISPMAGLVVVQAMPDELRKVDEYLKSAQLTLNRQVILDAKIIEVELNDGFQAGINWEILSGRIRATEFGGEVIHAAPNVGQNFPVLNTAASGSSVPVPMHPGKPPGPTFDSGSNVGLFGGVFTLAMNYKNLATFVELLGSQGKVHVLSSPRVTTLNNQKAMIKVGNDRFFITSISTSQTATTTTTTNTPNVTFDSFFSGVALDVTPSISENDDVTLHIHPAISHVEDEIKAFTINGSPQSVPLAASTVRETDTIVNAKSGQMIVIGGLMKDQLSELREGIPVLKDLPVIGALFRHTVKQTLKSELVILLRPIIVEGNTWPKQLEDTCKRLDEFEPCERFVLKEKC